MIGQGTLVRYKGDEKKHLWPGRMLSVHERDGEKVVVWVARPDKNDFITADVNIKDVEEIC